MTMNNIFKQFNVPERKEPFQLCKKLTDDISISGIKDKLYYAQTKYDGLYSAFIENNSYSRSGKFLHNVNFKSTRNYGSLVIIGEVVNPHLDLHDLSGIMNPNRTKPVSGDVVEMLKENKFMIHDAIMLKHLRSGQCPFSYKDRYDHIKEEKESGCLPDNFEVIDNEWSASGSEIVSWLKGIDRTIRSRKIEGMVFKETSGTWNAGNRSSVMFKRVPMIDLDLKCIGMQIGLVGKRRGVPTNLEFKWKDGLTLIADLGIGWTDKRRLDLLSNSPVGKIYRVYAMKYSKNGLLRNPKVGEERIDKTSAVADY